MTAFKQLLTDNKIQYAIRYMGEGEKYKQHVDNWELILWNDNHHEKFTYFTGLGHRKSPAFSVSDYRRMYGIGYRDMMAKASIPIMPSIDRILTCLVVGDYSIEGLTFEEWCSEYGYDTDSIKALDTYKDIKNNSIKLRNVLSKDIIQDIIVLTVEGSKE